MLKKVQSHSIGSSTEQHLKFIYIIYNDNLQELRYGSMTLLMRYLMSCQNHQNKLNAEAL